jgi:CheY-like chemotaxis protein
MESAHAFGLLVRFLFGEATSEETAMIESAERRPLRVLVVDDNTDCATALTLLVRRWGHEARVAADARAALAAASDFWPDVALLDLSLPGQDGCELARRLRATPGMEFVVLVAITGYTAPEYHRRAAEAGFAYYLLKPTDPATLRQLLAGLAAETAETGSRCASAPG